MPEVIWFFTGGKAKEKKVFDFVVNGCGVVKINCEEISFNYDGFNENKKDSLDKILIKKWVKHNINLIEHDITKIRALKIYSNNADETCTHFIMCCGKKKFTVAGRLICGAKENREQINLLQALLDEAGGDNDFVDYGYKNIVNKKIVESIKRKLREY